MDTFDLPTFDVGVSWTLFTPLTFDVTVPYFLAETVERVGQQYGFTGPVFTHEGLPREQIQGVVDAVARGRRAGARALLGRPAGRGRRTGTTSASERLARSATLRRQERADVDETLSVGSVSSIVQAHDQDETVTLGGVFNVSTFDDGPWGLPQ